MKRKSLLHVLLIGCLLSHHNNVNSFAFSSLGTLFALKAVGSFFPVILTGCLWGWVEVRRRIDDYNIEKNRKAIEQNGESIASVRGQVERNGRMLAGVQLTVETCQKEGKEGRAALAQTLESLKNEVNKISNSQDANYAACKEKLASIEQELLQVKALVKNSDLSNERLGSTVGDLTRKIDQIETALNEKCRELDKKLTNGFEEVLQGVEEMRQGHDRMYREFRGVIAMIHARPGDRLPVRHVTLPASSSGNEEMGSEGEMPDAVQRFGAIDFSFVNRRHAGTPGFTLWQPFARRRSVWWEKSFDAKFPTNSIQPR